MATNNAPLQSPTNESFTVSYLKLRQAIGVMGLLLPFVLIFGSLFMQSCNSVQPSISHYYYSVLHIVFVGVLCILGAFLIFYTGKYTIENKTSNWAGVFAFGVAIFPTGVEGFRGNCTYLNIAIPMHKAISYLHLGFALGLFICFIIFCFKIFILPDSSQPIDNKKILRNKLYKFCGWGILISILCISAFKVVDMINKTDYSTTYNTTLIFETTSLLFFGFSWLLKGTLMWPNSSNKFLRNIISAFR